MTGPGRSVDVTSHAEFDFVYSASLGYNIADLNMTANMLIFWNGQVVFISFVFL